MWDKLIKDWKYVIKYKPWAPKKSVAFIVQYSGEEDKFDMEIKTLHDTAGIKNRTEDGHGYIYECCREAGLNAAFVLKPDTVEMLSETNCDFVIIPSLEHDIFSHPITLTFF